MARFVSETQYVCSIYPGKLEPFVANVGPSEHKGKGRRTVWQLTPIKRHDKKKPFDVLKFDDAFEDVPDITHANGGRLPTLPKPVACERLIENALAIWCANIPGLPSGATPGIMKIANSVPTEAELRELERRQALFFDYWFQQGEKNNRENRRITQTMRDAAEWLGHNREWANPEKASDKIPCPFCDGLIRPTQFVCNHCQRTVKAIPPELSALNPTKPAQPAA